jgi:MFS family permease
VLFPTLLGIVSRTLPDSHRGRGTSVVSGVSYLGFLLGPAYVGGCASIGGLRVAMLAVGALPVVLALCVRPVLRFAQGGLTRGNDLPALGRPRTDIAGSRCQATGQSGRP